MVIDEAEATLVHQSYDWLIDERLTVRQILKRLKFGPWFPRSGRRPWSASVVHHSLADPVYTGTAYATRYDYVVPKKPRGRSPRTGERGSRRLQPRAQWMAVPVPALVTQATWDQAQAPLARNALLSCRRTTRNAYLLRCLLPCQTCGLAMHRHGYAGTADKPGRRYYPCAGQDPILAARPTRCPRARIQAEELERVVWSPVVALLSEPARLLAQVEHFMAQAGDAEAQEQAQAQQLETRRERLVRVEQRLLDAYQAEVITLEELAERRRLLAEQRQVIA